MTETQKYDLLIVDDERRICQILMDLFSVQGYTVRSAENGRVALDLIEQRIPDMVISDIQMPVMDGFELFRILEEKYPSVKHILMTSYDVDQYISLIRKYNIGNILVKGAEFSLSEVKRYVTSLLTGDIFGLERYFSQEAIYHERITNYLQAKEISAKIAEAYGSQDPRLEIAIDELISNAIYHGVLKLTGVPREQWREDYEIPVSQAIRVTWAKNGEKIGVSVEDPEGRLKKIDVLRWLDHPHDEILEGEEHGRGFLLVRKLIDRFIINIDPGERTECILLQYFNREHSVGKKPLLIHEL